MILFEGEGFIAVDKPAGMLVIPGRGEHAAPPLKEQLEAELKKKLWVVHRLDRDTSGVLLFALNDRAHRTLSMAFEAGRIEKKYVALVQGAMAEPVDIDAALAPARRGRMRIARKGEDSKNARTLVRPLESFAKASLVEATPLTGRTHQIRVHLASVGHPLLVDHQYGSEEPVRNADGAPVLQRTPLHAETLVMPVLEGISARTIQAPLPKDIAEAITVLRAAPH
ncbi:MAG: RluA family pseudouridine synthase [Myxococcaceae bacterium]